MPWVAVVVALTVVLAVEIGWELYRMHKLPGNHICIWDILWTLAGAIVVCWFPWLVAYLLAIDG